MRLRTLSLARSSGVSTWLRAWGSSPSLSAAASQRLFSTTPLSPSSTSLLQGLQGRSLKRIDDYSAGELEALLAYSRRLKSLKKEDKLPDKLLCQKSVAMIFEKSSTRTRVSTETGMSLLGGHALFLSNRDMQLGRGETIEDTARVLCRFNSLVLARVMSHSTVEELSKHSAVPVINALSDMHHPLQTLADFMALQEHLGSDLRGKKLAWVGDGNNVLHDLMLAAPLLGVDVAIATPKGYEPDAGITADTQKLAAEHGSKLVLTDKPEEAVAASDVVVTDTWISMGQDDETQARLKAFEGYQVTMDLMKRGGANPGWRFLHCLPRHEEEVDNEVFYSEERSLVWDEAENRMWTVMAVMSTMLGKLA